MASSEDILNSVLPSAKRSVKNKPAASAPVGQKLAGFNSPPPAPVDQSQDNGGGDWFSNIINTPVVKEIMNILGTGSYTVGNLLNPEAERIAKATDLAERGNVSQQEKDAAMGDALNPLNWLGDIVSAPVKGIMGGVAQNPDFQITPSKAIRRAANVADDESTGPAGAVGGFIVDAALDPLNVVGLGAPTAAVKGAVKGVRAAQIAEKSARAAGEAGQIGEKADSLASAALKGAKDEMAARRTRIQDEKSTRQFQKDLKRNGIPAENVDETISGWGTPGYSLVPAKVSSGKTATTSAKDLSNSAFMQKVMADAANSAEDPAGKLSAIDKTLGKPIDDSTAAIGLRTIMHQTDSATIDDALSKPPRVRQPRSVEDAVQSERANGTKLPDSEVKVSPNQVRDLPPAVKQADYSHFTAADRFVVGTEHLMGEVPKYSNAVAKRVSDYIASHPLTTHTMVKAAEYDFSGLKNTKGFVLRNNRAASDAQVRKFLADNPDGNAILDKFKKTPDLSKYETSPANVHHMGDINSINIADLTKLGLKEEDYVHAMMGNPLSELTRPTDKLPKILDQMANGEILDPAAIDKFHTFMKGFTENPDISLFDAIDKAKQFLNDNAEAVTKAERSLSPTSVGRISGLRKESPQVYIQKLLPSETATQFRKPLTQEESTTRLMKAWDEIDSRMTPDVAEIAAKHADIAEDSLAIRNGSITAGKLDKWFTTESQIKVFEGLAQDLAKNVVKKMPKVKAWSPRFIKQLDDDLMVSLARIDTELKLRGVFPYMTHMMPKGGTAIRASLFDVLDAMGPALRKKYIYGDSSAINSFIPSQVADMAETIARSIMAVGPQGDINIAVFKPEAVDALKGKFKGGAAKEIESRLPNEGFNKSVVEANLSRKSNPSASRETAYRKIFDDFTKVHEDGSSAMQAFAERVLTNTQLHNSIMSNKIATYTANVKDKMDKAFQLLSPTEAHVAVNDVKPVVSEVEPEAAQLATKAANEVVSEHATPLEQIHANATNKIAQERSQEAINSLNAELAARTSDPNFHPDRIADSGVLENGGMDALVDLTAKDLGFDVATRMYFGQKIWNPLFGKSVTWETVSAGTHLVTALETAFHTMLNDFAKKFHPEKVAIAYKTIADPSNDVFGAIARGEKFDPVVHELAQMMDIIFNPQKNNFFGRNGVSVYHINSILKNMEGFPKTWRFIGDTPEEMARSFQNWKDVENPLKMLEGMHMAITKAAFDVSAASRYSQKFGLKEVPKGEVGRWVKLDPEAVGGNAFAHLIDRSLFYPKEVIDELPALSRMISESRIPFRHNETLRKWTTEVFDPLVSAMKLTQTTVKPGHHVMSITGDLLRNMLAGMGFHSKEYKDAWNILRARQQAVKELSPLDEYARTVRLTQGLEMRGEGPGVKLMLGGKPTHVSYNDLYQLLEARDTILPVHSTGIAEDLLTGDTKIMDDSKNSIVFKGAEKIAKGANNFVTKLTNNRVVKINKFTAQRDNFPRVALALYYMQSRSFKSLEDAADYASKMIRKAAPTARDLTATESKYLRRVIFYYTWQRGILPRVLEWSLERPAQALLPSKLMYNIALSNGVNPQSYGDPFPPDTIMPDYYRNTVLGPQWKDPDSGQYWGINPTSPLMDTLNSLGSGITPGNLLTPIGPDSAVGKFSKTLLGMTNPLLKGPVELSTGRTLGTDVPIVDPAQYIMDIPGPSRFVSQVTGKEILPSAGPDGVGFANRTEAKYRNGLAGGDDAWIRNAIPPTVNWLTGAQLKDFNTPGAVKNAQFKQKQDKTDAQRQQMRMT